MVVHEKVLTNPCHLHSGGCGDGIRFVLEDDGPRGLVLGLDSKRSGLGAPLCIFCWVVKPEDVFSEGVGLWDGGDHVVLIFGGLKNWLDYLVIHFLLGCGRYLVLCDW